jgi:cystathionine beta-lyase/cystathionine gamma-synthase
MQPIVLSSTFAQDGPGAHKGYDYSRAGNPTRTALEGCLAALENGSHAIAFASGCAATTTLLLTLKTGDHVVASDDVYGGTFRIFDKVMKDFGVEATFIDMTDLGAAKKAVRKNTRMLWVETPSNPMLKIIDIAGLAEIARGASAQLCVDNTFATPILQRPLELGATMVLHSMTKYLNGHSDVVAGCVMTRDAALGDKLHFLQKAVGAVPSPFDCYMVLRGLKTLAVRMDKHVKNARELAQFLATKKQVRRVLFPGLPSHPGHALAERQMSGPGGMISFDLDGGLPASTAFLRSLRVFACAESLGGVESLAEHPALMTHASLDAAARHALGIGDGLLRLSVGIEDASDLREDLERALDAAAKA